MESPIAVEFPLRGEWVAYHTPAERVPSHGTDQLGQRYAYDFLRIDPEAQGFKFFAGPVLGYHLRGVALHDCYGWGEPIHAPFDAIVLKAQDGMVERDPVQFVRDFARVIANALSAVTAERLHRLVGNHVILKARDRDVFALLAHGRCGSVKVRQGDTVGAGEPLADVGHSGNSTAPHLHFQLMDRADILTAQGLPCCFREYEAREAGAWRTMTNAMPPKRQPIRRSA